MAYDINAALERLENNLAEVDSAKKQVEETIATSESLQQIIGTYTESLHDLNKDISTFIEEVRNYQDIKTAEFGSATDAIKTSCESVVGKFNVDVKTAIKSFDEKFAETIVKFDSENENLRIQVNKLHSLQEVLNKSAKEVDEVEKKVDILATELKESQDEQDKILASVKSSVETLPSSVESHAEVIVSEIKDQTLGLKTKSEEISRTASKAIQKLDRQISVLTETKVLCDGIKGDIENLKNSIDSQFESMKSAINTNRWIVIIGIMVLIIHFAFHLKLAYF